MGVSPKDYERRVADNGAAHPFRLFRSYCSLVFSYLFRTLGTLVVVLSTWSEMGDPTESRIGLWLTALSSLAFIWGLGFLVGWLSSLAIRSLTGRPPWQR